MSRRKSSIKNITVALISEAVVALVGFLFPQAIIVNYGSRANGLITSLQQFIQYFTLIEAGLSGAAMYALYKPLAENDTALIERILYSAKRMYRKMGVAFVLLVAVASVVYPAFIADTGYPYWMVSLLFCLIGLNGATQLLFIGKYKVLLNASQNSRYVVLLNSVTTCIFSLVIVILSYWQIPVLMTVALGASAYLLRAWGFHLVVRKKFSQYSYQSTGEEYHFKNQREVFIQQILTMLVMNAGILILSFSKTDMAEISVFTVYNLVLTAVFMLTNAAHNGVSASFGDLIARQDKARLRKAYGEYEMLYQVFFVMVFSCVSVLYMPFMRIYTRGFTDAQYVRSTLCMLFSILGAVWSIRIQQSVIIVAAGKFKEIQRASVIEAALALILCASGLFLGGLEGLMIGRILAAVYRMIDFTRFSHRHVMELNTGFTWKGVAASALVIVGMNRMSTGVLRKLTIDTYGKWIVLAGGVAVFSAIAGLLVSVLLYRKEAMSLIKRFGKRG